MNSTILLLFLCGFMFAVRIMISKAALLAGAQPFQLAFVGNLGAGLCLLACVAASSQRIALERRHIALYATLGVLSFATPTILSYLVVQRVGPAYTSTIYSLSPVMTMSLAALLGVESLFIKRSIGILIGFAGILLMLREQAAQMNVDQPFWAVAGLSIPLCAAASNIIRSKYWTKDITILGFSCATLITSGSMTLFLSPLFERFSSWSFGATEDCWMACLIAASVISYLLNFRLQSVGGPVTFSQLGYWGTGFGVVLSALLFGDVLTMVSLLGVAAIISGGVLARRRAEGEGRSRSTGTA